jgi:DNA-binding FadR family transcriptional regulator
VTRDPHPQTFPGQAGTGRRVLSDAVAEWIEARILDGSFKAGERLPPERDLAEQLGVNRSSVREALKKLEQLRLVEIQQGSGIRACRMEQANLDFVLRLLFVGGQPNLDRVRDLLELRDVLFVGMLRIGLERATEAELAELVEALDAAADLELPDERYPELVVRIQDVASRMTHNQVALLLWNSLRRFFEHAPLARARGAIIAGRREFSPLFRRLALAAKARDADTAVRALRELLRRAERLLLDWLASQTEAAATRATRDTG